ncbi:MAG: MFS transporter [Planctomycetaceae bacterium]
MTQPPFDHIETAQSPPRTAGAYGWVMVVVAALAMVATLPGRTHGLGMITERLLDDPTFNLTRTSYGQFNLWATLLGSLFCLGIGSCIDRFGTRGTLAVVMFALGGVVLAMTETTSLMMLFVAIMLTRGLGQSALSVVSISIVGKWFGRRVSLPMAIYSVLMAAGFIAAALIGREFADVDWRTFWSVLGWGVLGLAVVLTGVARDPALPVQRPVDDGQSEKLAQADFTAREAMRTPMFWVCSLSISLYGMIVAGISLFNESILVDRGFAKEVYYESLAWGTGIGVAANLLAGFLGLYLSVSRLLSIALLMLAGSLVWLTRLTTYSDVIVYVAVSAIAGGMLTVLFFSAWPDLYGRAHLGKIQGVAQMMTVLASAFGPLIFASTREKTGSYDLLIWILAGCTATTAVIAWLTPAPRK